MRQAEPAGQGHAGGARAPAFIPGRRWQAGVGLLMTYETEIAGPSGRLQRSP